jgi:hypothetical protein
VAPGSSESRSFTSRAYSDTAEFYNNLSSDQIG